MIELKGDEKDMVNGPDGEAVLLWREDAKG